MLKTYSKFQVTIKKKIIYRKRNKKIKRFVDIDGQRLKSYDCKTTSKLIISISHHRYLTYILISYFVKKIKKKNRGKLLLYISYFKKRFEMLQDDFTVNVGWGFVIFKTSITRLYCLLALSNFYGEHKEMYSNHKDKPKNINPLYHHIKKPIF